MHHINDTRIFVTFYIQMLYNVYMSIIVMHYTHCLLDRAVVCHIYNYHECNLVYFRYFQELGVRFVRMVL